MSEGGPAERTLVVGGGPGLGFAVAMEDVRRLLPAGALPPAHRRITLGRLLDGTAEAADARFAELEGAEADTFLDLGPDVRVRTFAAEAFEPVPAAVATTARRWGLAERFRDGDGYRIVLDVRALAALAAPRTAPAGPA